MKNNAFMGVIVKIESITSILILGCIAFTVFAQVMSRFVLKTPLAWTEELSRFSLVWLTFISASLVLGEDGHFTINVLPNKLTGLKKKILMLLIYGLMFVFIVIMFVSGLKLLPIAHMQESPALDMHMSYVYLSIPIGALLMALHIFVRIYKVITAKGDK